MNRAHFPEVYSKSMPSQRSNNSSDSNNGEKGFNEILGDEEESKEIVDWKYEHPKNLRESADMQGKSGGDVIDEDDSF